MPKSRPRHVLGVLAAAALLLGSAPAKNERVLRAHVPEGETKGVPWRGESGVRESVRDIMDRQALAPRFHGFPRLREEPEGRPGPVRPNPDAPEVSQWPPAAEGALSTQPEGTLTGTLAPLAAQTIATNFKAISLLAPNESLFIPPDSMGDVGPTQILAIANGRIKVFDKSGVLGGLNVTDSVFFSSVTGGADVTDPQVRFDRLSGRWFVTELTTTSPNKILIAVSSGPTIDSGASFTFFAFQHDLVGTTPNSDTGGFADYDSLGVDASALYIGVDAFNAAGNAYIGSTAYVVNKAALLTGTLTVTAFRQIATGTAPGPFAPRGVDNDDPASTQGFFIGVDALAFSTIDIRRVSNPGGTPSISGNITLTVLTTDFPIPQAVKGSASNRRLDALDDRLYTATIHKNKITGVTSLWTAQNIETNASGVVSTHGTRNASRWYEIGNLGTTPTVIQSGTLFDTASSNPRGFWIPSVAESGQGHMAMGISYAGTNDFAGVATAGRLRTDTSGTIQPPTLAQISSSAYNQQAVDGQRWGDYSHTVVDPTDDMTFWTFQEWCDATDSWGLQAIQLRPPPPAAPASASPASVCSGVSSVNVTVTGTSSAGSEFFDPGPDPGGPGYANRIAATVSGSGVSVQSVAFTNPTHVTLSLSTVGATAGARDITVTNPDGQSSTGTGLLTITGAPAPAASNNGPICAGSTLRLSAATVAGATYSWTGPNGFTSTAQNPSIPAATAAAAGTYRVTVTLNGCTSDASQTTAEVSGDGGACEDGNACTQGDTCQAGACVSGPARDADADGHVDSQCGGDDCNDGDPLVWGVPRSVTGFDVSSGSPTPLVWDAQSIQTGPETASDLASGIIQGGIPFDFTAAVCLQSAGGSSFSDARPNPSFGTVTWYLARDRNSCGTGTYGSAQEDASLAACP